jgi:hypothetical protein
MPEQPRLSTAVGAHAVAGMNRSIQIDDQEFTPIQQRGPSTQLFTATGHVVDASREAQLTSPTVRKDGY